MGENFSSIAAFIWSVADLLRGDFKQSQYGRIILPFTVLRRLECVLEPSKAKVLAEYKEIKKKPEEFQDKILRDDEALSKPGVVRSIYDPTAGTGGFLSSGSEYLYELNPKAKMAVRSGTQSRVLCHL